MSTTELIHQAAKATTILQSFTDDTINMVLRDTAEALCKGTEKILAANRIDLERMERSNPK